MVFSLRDILRTPEHHAEAQRAEGKRRAHNREEEQASHTEQGIRRSTSEEQAIRQRMAKLREAKARKRQAAEAPAPAPAPPAPTRKAGRAEAKADTVQMPEDASYRRLYLTLLLLAQEQIADGWGPVVPHWKVMQQVGDSGERFEESPRIMLQDLEREGFVRQIITRRKGTLAWIPVALDSKEDGRPARSAKGGRSSDIARAVDALETEYLQGSKRR